MFNFLVYIFIAGAIGGLVNALISDNGFVLPRKEGDILRPGVIGNIIIGGVAACISWGLYGPYSSVPLFQIGGKIHTEALTISLTISSFVGAILIGVGGARWLTNEVDKNLLKTAVGVAASKAAIKDAGLQISNLSSAGVLSFVKKS